MQLGDCLSLTSCIATVIGLYFAGWGIYRGNKNSSAALLLTFNESVRVSWERFLSATDDDDKEYQFAELANQLEIACALHKRGAFVGVSRELLTEYLNEVISMLNNDDDAKERLKKLSHSEETFKYLKAYQNKLAVN